MGGTVPWSAPSFGNCEHILVENYGKFAPIFLGAVRSGADDVTRFLARKRETLAMGYGGAVWGSESRGILRSIDLLGFAAERAHLEASSGSCRRVLYSPMVCYGSQTVTRTPGVNVI